MRTYLIAIDGNCGSGKTTLSLKIKEKYNCNIFHMDDYYLPLSKREKDWEQIPGGNIDIERFKREVLEPAKKGLEVHYQSYFCRGNCLREIEVFEPSWLTIIEGSYSHHPQLADYYDKKIFLTCSKEEQEKRLRLREGERYPFYEQRWIPMEERYYRAFDIKNGADEIYDTKEYLVYDEILKELQNIFALEDII